ncbi:MAG TPA: PaaI family thioesterase [Solirubrobacteraceae bacterium]
MELQGLLPYEETFDALYGLEVLEVGEEHATARVPVRDAVKQAMGLVHGGVYASIAESLTSIATALAVRAQGKSVVGLSNQTSFLRPITEGTVHAEALRRHRGRTTWLWDVEITDDAGRICAVSRMTIAVRPNPGTGS